MKKKTVLIIDDVKFNIKAVQDMIGDSYTIIGALSAEAGLKILSNTRPDLILLDIIMPDVDGHQLLKTIKSHPEYNDIPIIFLTADNTTETEVEGFNEGVVDYITKPFVAEVLSKRIETQIQLADYRRFLKDEANNKIQSSPGKINDLTERICSDPVWAADVDRNVVEKMTNLIPLFSQISELAISTGPGDIPEGTVKEFTDTLEKIKAIL